MTEAKDVTNDYTGRLRDDYATQTLESSDYERSDENKSSDEIKADIERKRGEMSQKINMIQERLDPTRLKEQAQETVRSAVSDSTDAVVQYVRDNVGDFGTSLIDTIKQNPVPAALIGIGLGWLLVESFTGSSRQSNDNRYRQQYTSGRDYGYGYTGAQSGAQYGARDTGEVDNGSWAGSSSSDRYSSGRYGSGSQYASGVGYQPTSQFGSSTSETTYATGYLNNPTSEQQESGRVGQAVQAAQDKASDVIDQARDKAGQLTDQVQDTAKQATSYVQDQVSQVREQASQLGTQAQRKVQQTLESNPIPFGAAALIAGALIALALPETRTENELLGETRDQLVDNAQSLAQDVKQRVQNVVEDKLPEVKQTAQKAVEDLKQTGKEVAQDLQQTGKETAQDLKQAGKESAQNLPQTTNQSGQDTKQAAKDAANNIKQDAKNAWQETKQEAKNTWEEGKQGAKNAWQETKQDINNASSSTAPEEEGSTKNAGTYSQTNR